MNSLVINPTSSLTPTPEVRGPDLKLQPSIHGWFPWQPATTPRCFAQVLIHIIPMWWERLIISNKTPISSLWLWNIFRNWGHETKYYNKKRCPQHPYCSGNAKGFGSCEGGTWMKTKYIWEIHFGHSEMYIYNTCYVYYHMWYVFLL